MRWTVEIETDEPRMSGVDETLHIATITQRAAQIRRAVEVRCEVLIHDGDGKIRIAHI